MGKVLYLLEDDSNIAELVECALQLKDISVVAYSTCAEFLKGFFKLKPDVAILDVMLPDGSGLDVLRKIKASNPEIPVIIMSALGQETDKVKGLNLGADDYISKPFGVLEMAARVSARLRSAPDNGQGGAVIKCGGVTLDEGTMSVTLDGQPLELNRREFALLKYFMKNRGLVLSRDKLLEQVWGYDYGGETRTVDNHVARLRRAGLDGYFTTVFGSGYKFSDKGQGAE